MPRQWVQVSGICKSLMSHANKATFKLDVIIPLLFKLIKWLMQHYFDYSWECHNSKYIQRHDRGLISESRQSFVQLDAKSKRNKKAYRYLVTLSD